MRVVYRYIDKKDGLVKYIGIVTSDKRTLSQRVKEHTSDSWYDNGDWLIEYFTEDLDTKGECESWEGHLIAKRFIIFSLFCIFFKKPLDKTS